MKLRMHPRQGGKIFKLLRTVYILVCKKCGHEFKHKFKEEDILSHKIPITVICPNCGDKETKTVRDIIGEEIK
jgi:rubredoxin